MADSSPGKVSGAGGTDATPALDLEVGSLIADFIADEEKPSLELPTGLSAEQRKEVKRLVEEHPELKCESFGFGEERRLHLFKKNQAALAPVRIKNTFIDDWKVDGAGGEEPAFRSMPPCMPVNLLERTLQRCAEEKLGDRPEDSIGPDLAAVLDGSAATTNPDLPPMPDGFKVRNTFIHIESVPMVERIVQSMPHGMFSQCLQAELKAQTPAIAEHAATVAPLAEAAEALEEGVLLPGTEVIITGLIKLPDFNGLTGMVQSMDADTGRYDVLLDGPAGQCAWRWVKVKRDNCKLRMPPPPSSAPKLAMDCLEAAQDGDCRDEVPATPTWDDGFACAPLATTAVTPARPPAWDAAPPR